MINIDYFILVAFVGLVLVIFLATIFFIRQKYQNIINSYELKLANIEELFRVEKESLKEKIAFLENNKQQMKLEFENLANRLFDDTQKKSNQNINQVLTPFKEQLTLFGTRVNEIFNEDTKQRSSLITEIKNLKELNNQISQDAINLTKALKGQNKLQGDWGEMILSSILEQTGLRKGLEYKVQNSFKDDSGKLFRPDVIVHLPTNKDIIIDSKLSLNSYIDYTNSEDENDKKDALNRLLSSINSHIKDLSSKKYENLSDLRSLDFVLMFIPIEGAFILLNQTNQNIFELALKNNIMLVSPSTLYITLRTIENIWADERQNENAKEISKQAGDLYDKFVAFVEDVESIGNYLNKSQDSYQKAMNKLSSGRGNLISRAEKFLDLGVKPNKKISEKYLLNKE
ncbi:MULTISPECIES: DNA recombination protein RmuC [Aliarcobacter]|uniref:DNA recombination protein RmuC n=1 Tax=Aliarcobacter vitoriensis TaxID=2011099 RepID=A0A366MWW6_9BACT|nr:MULTISPECIES: DNA recombination protein RmuC [Aliarcobacter]RBQ29902.1 DNA recombination protein RmuC [Aliarcobacter vitoriensis]